VVVVVPFETVLGLAPTPQSIDSVLAGAAPTNRLATPAVASATIAVDVDE